jgi:hypothetical protein
MNVKNTVTITIEANVSLKRRAKSARLLSETLALRNEAD